MKTRFNFQGGAMVLPSDASRYASKATKRDIQILLRLAAEPTLIGEDGVSVSALAEEFGCKKADVESSISFWQSAGVLASDMGEETETRAVEQHKIIKPQSAPPKYTTEEIAAVLEGRGDLPGIIDECQNAIGKIFNSHEVKTVISLVDYLGIGSDYLLVLINYCKRIGRMSLHYVEKVAYEMYNDGVDSAKELEARLTAKELASSLEGKIRKLFGIKDRALTTKEMQFIARWASEFHYELPVIKHAYEITINAIKEPSLPYTNAILEKWSGLGLDSLEAITGYEAEKAAKKTAGDAKASQVKLGKSFDTDEFFEAALRRSLADDQ